MKDFMMDAATPAEVNPDPQADKYLFERISKIETTYYECRIWCGETMTLPLDELRDAIEGALEALEQIEVATADDVMATLMEICSIKGMNSSEIKLKSTGVGMCVHKNWP